MPLGTLGLAFLAGILSVLSPCVLPLVPIVLGTAASEHRLGPLALAAGLAISFTTIGLFVATVGFAMGLDTDVFRLVSAVLLIGVGLVLLAPRLQEQFAVAAGPVSQWAGGYLDNFAATGLAGQFGLGPPARSGVESMRRADSRRGLSACRQGRESRPGRADHARLRHRRRFAADAARLPLARSNAALAQAVSWKQAKAARRCSACCCWRSAC